MGKEQRHLIRRIDSGEWPTLRALRLRSLAEAPSAFGQRFEDAAALPDAEWIQVTRAASEGDQRAWFLAFQEDAPVGLVQGRRRRPASLLLFSLWVAPEARRQAVGIQLIDGLEGWALGWHATETILWVIHGNDAATAFYRSLGFKQLTSGPDAESGAEHGATAFRRPIRSGYEVSLRKDSD